MNSGFEVGECNNQSLFLNFLAKIGENTMPGQPDIALYFDNALV